MNSLRMSFLFSVIAWLLFDCRLIHITISCTDLNHAPCAVLYAVNLHEKMLWIIENSISV
jgi:hypothetical protein